MRVVQASTSRAWLRRSRAGTPARAARIERLGLIATSLVLLLGMWMVTTEQLATTPGCHGDSAAVSSPGDVTACVHLSAMTGTSDLTPALRMFTDPATRRAVSRAILARLTARTADPLQHVGGLAGHGLTSTDIAAIKPFVIVRTPDEFTRRIARLVVLFMTAFWLAHLLRWWAGTTGDAVLLPVVHLLSGLGLMTMIALRDPLRDTLIAGTAVQGIAVGCAIWVAASLIDFEHPLLRRSFAAPLIAALTLATALLVFGSGPTGSGAKVNLFGVQPVDAIRLLVVLALAAYFARRWQFLRQFSERIGSQASWRGSLHLPRWKDVRPLATTLAILLAFFFLQKDLGPALVLSCVFLGLYGVSRDRVALVVGGFGVLAASFAIGHALGVPGTVAQRVAMWLDPWANAGSGGDQIAHALWALASGGVLGLGPGVGDPQFIPAGHTDLVLAALGEDLGYVGVLSVLVLIAMLVWRMLGISLRAPGDYTVFLTAGLTIALAAQAIVIIGGLLGLLPLAGVVTPFLSFGRSSMLSNFAAVAICCAVGRRRGSARAPFIAPFRALQWTMAIAALAIVGRATLVEVVHADTVAARANLTRQADGGYRYQYNPRLVAAARTIERGTIFDRNGIPLATSNQAELSRFRDRLGRLGVTPACTDPDARCYPLGGAAFHLLGHADSEVNWSASNTAFAEQQFDEQLQGFNDHTRVVQVRHPQTGARLAAVRRDYGELLPLVRHKADRSHPSVLRILERDRDVHLTVDAGLQLATARALRARAIESGSGRGAAVVVDPATGELLASASYPWPDARELRGETTIDPEHLLDRARFGLYPPGSTFKVITAVAALRRDPQDAHTTFQCVRLPDGRVGGRVPGLARPVRDDEHDSTPHGTIDLHRALVVSCNGYFANLARKIGPQALAETAAAAQIAVAVAPVTTRLARSLPHAGYGQGEVVATPLRMAGALAAVAADGVLRDITVRHDPKVRSEPTAVRWLDSASAAVLRRDLRDVVMIGTGRSLASHRIAIAGKTGTAEVDKRRSHAWFAGFAPYGTTPPRIAFAVVVEHAGYGGRVAAPLAGEIVSAADARGLLKAPR